MSASRPGLDGRPRAPSPLRLVFFGTPEFAGPTLDRLLEGPHPLVAVVSQPDRPRGRGRRPTPSPIAARALEAGVPLLRPERAGDREFVEALADHAPDLGVVVAFGQFLTRRVRELPSLGYLINGHASLLPRHRGAAPIAQAILSGDRETGVAVMRVEREMDAGPVCHVERTAIAPGETAGELEARLAPLAARAIETGIARIAAGEAEWIGQDPSLVTLAPKLEREEGRLDFREAAAALALRVRAFTPRPGAFTTWGDEVLRILGAEFREGSTPDAPGTVRHGEDTLRIATGDGWLVPTRLQRPGGRALAAAEFLRGHPLPAGSRLGGTP